MSRFAQVYQPVNEGFGNWLKNTYFNIKEGDGNQHRYEATKALSSARFKKSILAFVANLIKQKEAGGKLTNKISLSKWDNDTKDYKERKKLINYDDYVLCIEVDKLNNQKLGIKALYVPMIPTDYKSSDENWYSKMEFFPIPIDKIIAEADKPRLDALKAAETAIKKAIGTTGFVFRGKTMPTSRIFEIKTGEYFLDDNIWDEKNCIDIATCLSYSQGALDDFFGTKYDYDDTETPLERAYHKYLAGIREKANATIDKGTIVFLELENGGRFGDGDEGFIWFDYNGKKTK